MREQLARTRAVSTDVIIVASLASLAICALLFSLPFALVGASKDCPACRRRRRGKLFGHQESCHQSTLLGNGIVEQGNNQIAPATDDQRYPPDRIRLFLAEPPESRLN